MPSFKPKASKKIKMSKLATTTLDGKHSEIVGEFKKDEENRIPALKQKRDLLRKRLILNNHNIECELNKIYGTGDGGEAFTGVVLSIEQVMEIKDQIIEVTQEIKNTKAKKKEYYLDNSKYIFDYFENKKSISSGEVAVTKNTILNSFFKIDKDKNESIQPPQNGSSSDNNTFSKYLSNIDDAFLDINNFVRPTDICQACHKGELIPMDDEGVMICNICSVNVQYLTENDKPSYKEPPKEVCFYAYKKINHFKEILAQFQGKETTQIPEEVIENLKLQIKKERIDISNMTYYKTKELLKKLGFNKYYEHINFIKDKLGLKPPIISQDLEETLCNFFMEIQYPYAKHCPDYRVNFLHYYYVLFKLFELLGENHYLIEIPMLKDREKLIEQDTIWKRICGELDWEFIATV